MREELKLMELVDRYLRGEMDAAGRDAFEERMRSNAEMRELVRDQQALIMGMDRLGARMAVDKAYRSYRFGKWAPGIGGASIILLIIAGAFLMNGGFTERSHTDPDRDATSIPMEVSGSDPGSGRAEPDIPEDRILGTIPGSSTDTLAEESIMLFAEPEPREKNTDQNRSVSAVGTEDVEIRTRVVDPGKDEATPAIRSAEGMTPPEYPGGELEMRKFIYANLKIPEEVGRTGVFEKITVRFVIDSDGRPVDIEADQGAGPAFEAEAERLIRIMPTWEPGTLNGSPVDVQMALPVIFMSQMERAN